MTDRVKRIVMGIAALAALALGGAAIAGATGGDDAAEHEQTSGSLSAADNARAEKAALQATGGGEVNSTELDGENGATYEVEVTKPDGKTVDVRLDDGFDVVVIEGDQEDARGDE
jgi:uncharacterized membrane protein YkoI